METTTVELAQNGFAAHTHSRASRYSDRKAWPTRVIAAVLMIPAAPVILLLVAIVRFTSPGPGLYRQTRTGKHGKEFQMYKIRTMVQDAETVSGPTWCKPGDSRITPIGRVLRLLHLDELPQLINILRGEMDLIGPRPERPAFVETLALEIPGYRDRLQVLPGVTGLAQVNLPPDETIECVRRKLILDRDYIVNASVGLDLRILICTSLRMLGIRHGRAVRWLRLERSVATAPVEPEVNVTRPTAARAESTQRHHRVDAALTNGHGANGASVAVLSQSGSEDVYVPEVREAVRSAARLARRPR